jgi:hypothetical protein
MLHIWFSARFVTRCAEPSGYISRQIVRIGLLNMLKDTFGLLIMAILDEEWKILSYRIHYEFTDTQRSLMVQNI